MKVEITGSRDEFIARVVGSILGIKGITPQGALYELHKTLKAFGSEARVYNATINDDGFTSYIIFFASELEDTQT